MRLFSSHLRQRLRAVGVNPQAAPGSSLPTHTASSTSGAPQHRATPARGTGFGSSWALLRQRQQHPGSAPTRVTAGSRYPRPGRGRVGAGSGCNRPPRRGVRDLLPPDTSAATSQSAGNSGGTAPTRRHLRASRPLPRTSSQDRGTRSRTAAPQPFPGPGLPQARPPACPGGNRSRNRSPSRAHLLPLPPPPPLLSRMLRQPEPSPHLQRS